MFAVFAASALIRNFTQVGNTPLMVASSKNHRECVELLLKSGCKINLLNKVVVLMAFCISILLRNICRLASPL